MRSNRRTSLETSLFSLAWPLRRLTSRGTKTLGPGLDGGHPGREGRGDGAVFETKFMRSMRFWPCGGAGANAGLSVLCASAYRWF